MILLKKKNFFKKKIKNNRFDSKSIDYRGRTPQKVEYGVPLLTARNIKSGNIDLSSSQELVREDEYKELTARGLPGKGDVLLTTGAPLGEVAQVNETKIALLDRETGLIDGLIDKIGRSIDLLKEKRAALISAAVTGKIDIRPAENSKFCCS